MAQITGINLLYPKKMRKQVTLNLNYMNLHNRILVAIAKAGIGIKGKSQVRLCVMIRMGWGHTDSFERNMKAEGFRLSDLNKLCEIFGVTPIDLQNPAFELNCSQWNLAIPEWISELELQPINA